ncbi:MAG: TIGR03032 family protein [Planctomycetota bacterium]|nr:MAG: TIGR03032 family protein [Planctomycetota bacterium]
MQPQGPRQESDHPSQPPPEGRYRELRYRHSSQFSGIIEDLEVSLLISTYQAGKLVAVGTTPAGLHISLHNFEQAMGLAVHPRQLAVGSRGVIWFLQSASEFAPRLDPPSTYDACYLARKSFITGNIHGHEMAWVGDELWVVNTLFSCLCTLDDAFSFVPRWQPPFITELAGNDRCHLNGLALEEGRPKFVTAMAESNEPAGWRPIKGNSGCLLDVDSGQAVCRGLSMPHSPRVYGDRLWLLNSGRGTLETVDRASGRRDVVDSMPGYTRGLAFHQHYAFVGLSRIRETAVFGGVPIAEHRDELKCAVAVVDLRAGKTVAFLEFETGVEEIFDVQVLPQTRCVSITGPYPSQDDAKDVWVVPPPGKLPHRMTVVRASGQAADPLAPGTISDAEVTRLVQSGLQAQQQGRFAHAVELLAQAAAARPQSPHIHNHLGNAQQDFNRQDLAEASYNQALAVDESFAPAHQNLGYMLINFGRFEEGIGHLEKAQQLAPADVNRVMLATALPIVYASLDEVPRHRQRMLNSIDRLLADNVQVDATRTPVPTNFFAAYQGFDDCQLQRKLSRLYRAPQSVAKGKRRAAGGRIHVGFLSSHFCDHTIGRLNLGRIQMLDREQFEVTVIALGHHRDPMADAFRQAADQLVEPTGSLEATRNQIADLKLDVLFFADVGMNAMTYTLALSRLAPVQCVTWGHPVTTGNASMDYFVSGRHLDTPGAEVHYTERLARLANLGTYYYRPRLEGDRSREWFGLDPDRHVYLCPQTLFKLHPEFDAVLAEILRRDPHGELILLEGRRPTWTRLVQERFARTMPDVADRIRFLPPQPNADFLHLNALADVSLDTLHFGGGNTSYEALAVGTPIVTLPGPLLKGRITYALYQKMSVDDWIVDSTEAYVEAAVRLGTDVDCRRAARRKILGANDVLFEDPAEVREVERFLRWAADGGAGEWSVDG